MKSFLLAAALCLAFSTSALAVQCVSGVGANDWRDSQGTSAVAQACEGATGVARGGISSDTLAICSGMCLAPGGRWGFHGSSCWQGNQPCRPGVKDRLGHDSSWAVADANSALWRCYNKFPTLAAFLRQNHWIEGGSVHFLTTEQLEALGVHKTCTAGQLGRHPISKHHHGGHHG